MISRTEFVKNYTGSYDPDKQYDYLKECEEIEKKYKGATYSESNNRALIQGAKTEAFSRIMRK